MKLAVARKDGRVRLTIICHNKYTFANIRGLMFWRSDAITVCNPSGSRSPVVSRLSGKVIHYATRPIVRTVYVCLAVRTHFHLSRALG